LVIDEKFIKYMTAPQACQKRVLEKFSGNNTDKSSKITFKELQTLGCLMSLKAHSSINFGRQELS
ncbi:unnamed protein product, partial [Ceratitis capitata]